MPVDCQKSTSGGKGNRGMFIERDPKVCAAGLPSQQPDDRVADAFQCYLLKDEVDALIGDAIVPPPKPRPLPPLRYPIPLDKRYAGPFGDVAALVNPPAKSKFQTLVNDLKSTPYKSFWKINLGEVPDPVPMFPEGYDISGTTYGKKNAPDITLYDLVMPKYPLPDKTPASKAPAKQIKRNYCQPPYDPDLTYGERSNVDKRGVYVKCALTDNRVVQGTAGRGIVSNIQADFQKSHTDIIGTSLTPNENIKNVPEGYTFGILHPPGSVADCLTSYKINPNRVFFNKCLGHLNCLRKILSTRYLPSFFSKLYLSLKYYDKDKSGWLPKQIIYDLCASKLIRFDPSLIEPLLGMWQAFDGKRIEYKTFVRVINYREPSPEIPKIPDFDPECLDFRTTYSEMVKPGQKEDKSRMAGLPSGRYFDMDYPVTPIGCCKAARTCLPHESDMRSCLNPSVLTLLNVSHRDMYTKREPELIRKILEATGEEFTDESFNEVWEKAKQYHSEGWVCFETFLRALNKDFTVETERPY